MENKLSHCMVAVALGFSVHKLEGRVAMAYWVCSGWIHSIGAPPANSHVCADMCACVQVCDSQRQRKEAHAQALNGPPSTPTHSHTHTHIHR